MNMHVCMQSNDRMMLGQEDNLSMLGNNEYVGIGASVPV